jgi:hypothetical protein
MRKLVILLVLAGFGCHRSVPSVTDAGIPGPDLCSQMVEHMLGMVEASGQLSFTQRMMMRALKSKIVDQCRAEGITQAQADCFLRVKTPDQMKTLDDCAALKAHPLKWLSMHSSDGGVDDEPAPPKKQR